MKKIVFAVLILMLVLTSASYAAKARGDGIKFGIGAIGLGAGFFLSNTPAFMPAVVIDLDPFSMGFGLNFSTQSGPNFSNSHFDILIKGDYSFSDGAISPHAGGIFMYSTDSKMLAVNQSISGFTFGGYYGGVCKLNPKFEVSADVVPITFSSFSMGGESYTILNIARGMVTAHYYL